MVIQMSRKHDRQSTSRSSPTQSGCDVCACVHACVCVHVCVLKAMNDRHAWIHHWIETHSHAQERRCVDAYMTYACIYAQGHSRGVNELASGPAMRCVVSVINELLKCS